MSITSLPWAESTDRDIDFKRSYPRKYYDYAVRWAVNVVQWHKIKLAGRHWSVPGLILALKISVARAGMLWWRWQK
jgi:anaerobic magnesium-protoporphyrin IX monomethyl ester cyclase